MLDAYKLCGKSYRKLSLKNVAETLMILPYQKVILFNKNGSAKVCTHKVADNIFFSN